MEPITHFLTGACMGRAGLNRKTAYATVVAALAAEAADLDVLWSLVGPVEGLKHHRGITHTFLAVPVVAAVVVAAVWAWVRWAPGLPWLGAKLAASRRADAQPVCWGWLYATAVVAALSHLLLDWTNNYGVRPFFPFNPRWYAGSFMFIVEPLLWLLFALAFAMPWLLGLADREIGARRTRFVGQGWAAFALVGMVSLWGWRWMAHAEAEQLVRSSGEITDPIRRVGLEPYPVTPFHWHAIVESDSYYQTAEVDTLADTVVTDAASDRIYRPRVTPAVAAARASELGRVYQDWGRWAVVRDLGQAPVAGVAPPLLPPGRAWTTVEFTDLRFAYSYLGHDRGVRQVPLTGWAYVVDGREVAAEGMGAREQR